MSELDFELDFWRLSGNSSRYRRHIQVNGLNEKLGTLYDDIFGSQARTKFTKPVDTIPIVENETRFVAEDTINTLFYQRYYLPPDRIRVVNSASKTEISYSEFYQRIIDCNDTNANNSEDYGSNRVSFLTGSIGDGKTALVSKLMFDLQLGDHKIIPIYISVEEDWTKTDRDGHKRPKPIDETFISDLLLPAIEKTIGNDPRLSSYCGNTEGLALEAKVAKTLGSIRADGFNVLLIFDDMDRYHFYHDKYTLFDEKGICSESLDQIIDLYKKFSKPDASKPFSYLGLSVLFVFREYVYSILDEREGLNPRGGTNTCYTLSSPDYKTVVNKRLGLLVDIIEELDSQTKFWISVRENVLAVKSAINSIRERNVADFSESTNLEKIFLLSQHGCRSIIDFMKGLKIFGAQDHQGVMERYLSEDHSALVVLYLLNHKYLYTQNNNHFPNLFLVNAHITSSIEAKEKYPEACAKHCQTYWLKFLLLSYVYSLEEQSTTVGELLSAFAKKGCYEPHIVKLAIGSLATPNWFSCLRFEYESSNIDMSSRRISITNRGRYILTPDKSGQPFCFTFTYLQLVIDDYLMHFPSVFDKYRINNDYSYLYEGRGQYGDGFVNLVKEKFPRVVYFIRMLESSFEIEMRREKLLFEYFQSNNVAMPEFDAIYQAVTKEIVAYLGKGRAKELLGNVDSLVSRVKSDSKFLSFFESAYLNNTPVYVGE